MRIGPQPPARGHRIFEVPIRYRARSREEGKKLTALDGVRVLRTLLAVRFAAGIGTLRRAPGRRMHRL